MFDQPQFVDAEYEARMAGYEADCRMGKDAKGDPIAAPACHHTAEFYSAVKNDKELASQIYAKNCEENQYGPSCFNLARFYYTGKGQKNDDVKAEELFNKACGLGHLHACYHLGVMKYKNVNKFPEAERPAIWKENVRLLGMLEKNCKDGEYESCYFTGNQYLMEGSPIRDPPRAIPLLEASCASNHAPSCFNLAVMYRKGDTGVPADPEKHDKYRELTLELVKTYGGLQGVRTG